MKFLLLLGLAWLAWRWWRRPVRRMPDARVAAARTLGVAPDADVATIRDAHRARVAAAHPDRGGSAAETQALNAARDRLLERS